MSAKLSNNFEEILVAFNYRTVDFMIVGGFAVIFHGYGRTTGDLDIWVSPTEENKHKIMDAFRQLHYPAKLIDYLKSIDFTQPFAVKIGNEPIQVDLFNAITGVKYEDAGKRGVSYKFSEDLEVRFIHLQDLIVNKMLTGRLKDAADVDQLHAINLYSKDTKNVSWLKKIFRNR